jgi:molybdate transport system permease protein
MDFSPLLLSLQLALCATAILVVLAAPLSYGLAYGSFRGKSLVEAFLNLPIALPPTVLGFYLLLAVSPRTAVGRFWEGLTGGPLVFTFSGIVLAAVLCSLPYAIQPMKAAFEKIDRRLLESAYVLGLSRLQTFARVVLPNSIPGIAGAAILVFLHSMGAFGVLLMVGGSIPGETRVVSIAIYEAVESLDYRTAALLSLAILPICYVFLFLVERLKRR